MRTSKKDTTTSYWFESLGELGRWIDETKRTWTSNNSHDHNPEESWDLRAGYSRSVKMAKFGWLEGAKQAQEALKQFPPSTPLPDKRNDFYGFMPHVPRFCSGAPDSMIRHANNANSSMGRVLTLIVPVNATGGVGAKYMRNFGLAVTQYINQLETAGTRVDVIGGLCSNLNGGRDRLAHAWRIKSADQPLDLAVLAFSIGHPAMFRRLGFALRERSSVRQDHSYGSSCPMVLSDVINAPAGAVILNGMTNAGSVARTPEQALEYISAQIDKALDNPEAA